jgi:hypothetical protein
VRLVNVVGDHSAAPVSWHVVSFCTVTRYAPVPLPNTNFRALRAVDFIKHIEEWLLSPPLRDLVGIFEGVIPSHSRTVRSALPLAMVCPSVLTPDMDTPFLARLTQPGVHHERHPDSAGPVRLG